MSQEMIDARKCIAEHAIRTELAKGHKLRGINGIERILQEYVKISELPEDFFNVLKDRDLCDLLANVADSRFPGQISDVTTPPSSDVCVEEQNEVEREDEQGTKGTQAEVKESVISLTYEDPVSDTEICLHWRNLLTQVLDDRKRRSS